MENELLHDVWIPSLHRDLTGGVENVKIAAQSVGQVIAELENKFPGMEDRLCEDGKVRPYIAVSVDGEISYRGLRHQLTVPAEIHFVPALSGG